MTPGPHPQKPSLGAMPRWLWCEHRILELARAMIRAEDHSGPHDGTTTAEYAREIRDVLNLSEEKK